MKRSSLVIQVTFSIAMLYAGICAATPETPSPDKTAAPAKTVAPRIDLNAALDVNDLAITMAESSMKVNPSLRATVELSSALEAHLSKNCFGRILQTLSYDGPPTDPDCIARMERLLEIYPNNPVAICVRDGIGSASCSEAYRSQTFRAYSGGSSSDSDIDPSLKAGLSAAETAKLKRIEATLRDVNSEYQNSKTDEDKQKHMDDAVRLYDQLLSVACRLVVIKLETPEGSAKEQTEEPSVQEAREKLLKIPPALRPDYQRKMLLEAETELARESRNPLAQALIVKRIEVINNPDKVTAITTQGKLRVRVALQRCEEYMTQASTIFPKFPSPTCHREGWYSPGCIGAIKQWHAYRVQLQEAAARRAGKKVPPTPNAIISSF